MTVFEKFISWQQEESKATALKLPNACSFTSIGLDGYPNTRFVSLKEVKNNSFIITGPLNSRKGQEILSNSKVSIAFWWTKTERQIRIQGDAKLLSNAEADVYFEERSRASKIVSTLFKQGQEIENLNKVSSIYQEHEKNFGSKIDRPKEWGGFRVDPVRIEFMQFKDTRLHQRELHFYENEIWGIKIIQP